MTRRSVGIVDYGVGNLGSVQQTLKGLHYRVVVSHDTETLSHCDLLVLPGVGAFPAAMASLHRLELVGYLQRWAAEDRPLLGLCLGMQLLASSSSEQGTTPGLGILPGRVISLPCSRWHIGWNQIEVLGNDSLMKASNGSAVYFNHSFVFDAPTEIRLCVTDLDGEVTAGVRSGKTVGLQFHPEKSQHAGRSLLQNVINGLCAEDDSL